MVFTIIYFQFIWFMRITELAKTLRISPNAVKRWVKKGELKATKTKPPKGVGGHDYWDVSQEDWEDYLKNQNG